MTTDHTQYPRCRASWRRCTCGERESDDDTLGREAAATEARATKGVDYVTLCISTYPSDLAQLDAKVAELRDAGWPRASRSSVIRAAVAALDTRDATIDRLTADLSTATGEIARLRAALGEVAR